MTERKIIWNSGHGFSFRMSLDQAASVSGPGPADEGVAYLARVQYVASQLAALDPEDIRSELRETGAWSAGELADDYENKKRLLWIVGCDLAEEITGESDDQTEKNW